MSEKIREGNYSRIVRTKGSLEHTWFLLRIALPLFVALCVQTGAARERQVQETSVSDGRFRTRVIGQKKYFYIHNNKWITWKH